MKIGIGWLSKAGGIAFAMLLFLCAFRCTGVNRNKKPIAAAIQMDDNIPTLLSAVFTARGYHVRQNRLPADLRF